MGIHRAREERPEEESWGALASGRCDEKLHNNYYALEISLLLRILLIGSYTLYEANFGKKHHHKLFAFLQHN